MNVKNSLEEDILIRCQKVATCSKRNTYWKVAGMGQRCSGATLERRWNIGWLNVSWPTVLCTSVTLRKGCCFFRISLAWVTDELPGLKPSRAPPSRQGVFICSFTRMFLWLSISQVLISLETLQFTITERYHCRRREHCRKQGNGRVCTQTSELKGLIHKWNFQIVWARELLHECLWPSVPSLMRGLCQQASLPDGGTEKCKGDKKLEEGSKQHGDTNVKYHYFPLCKRGISGM